MKTTFILKDFTDMFYNGNESGSIIGLNNMSDKEKFTYLNKKAHEYLGSGVKMKIGNGSFRDKVDLNQIMRGDYSLSYKLENRKGYRLATFEVE